MVLQRDQSINIWGWADPGEEIQVAFANMKYRDITEKDGKWMITLPAQEAGGPFNMEVRGDKDIIRLNNILIGDVWLCSGQSNMEWTVFNSNNAEQEISNANHPQIRHFKIPHNWSNKPEEHLDSSSWEVCNPENAGDFTAVGYFFARELREKVGVPIGLINSSWGGSRIEPWMHLETLGAFEGKDLQEYLRLQEEKMIKAMEEMKNKLEPLATREVFKAAQKNDFDDSKWVSATLPNLWEGDGFDGLDGIVYLRKEINLSEEEVKKGIKLRLAMIDDTDWTYVNGRLVGQMEQKYNVERDYEVSSEVLKTGKNTILIRVEDTGGGGGVYGDPTTLNYESVAGTHSLAGEWKMKVEKISMVSPSGMARNQTPVILYNKMIHPLHNFPIKGVIWYQGESNASTTDALEYRKLFKTKITDWRARWGIGDFPFLWVQLANYMKASEHPSESSWAVLRESQTAALDLKNTAQAVIIDIGEADDIHPRNKHDVGYRLSLGARKLAYDEQDLVYSSPMYNSMDKMDGAIIINFKHVGTGLMSKDKYGYVKGFSIAGKDGTFYWAKASIVDEGKVRVWSDQVVHPEHVRYAWANNPDDANLYNKEGLPACPFRTDEQD